MIWNGFLFGIGFLFAKIVMCIPLALVSKD